MKRILYSIGKNICKWLPVMAYATLTMTSCHTIFDGEGDCNVVDVDSVEYEYRVKFMYDYNMKYADAFPREVNSVSLYVFNDEGKFLSLHTDSGEALSAQGYTMPIDLPSGKYQFVVWAGLDGGKSFEVPALQPNVSTIDDLTCRMKRKTSSVYSTDSVGYLSPLWHGKVQAEVRREDVRSVSVVTETITVPLIKNTNTLRIILQQLSDGMIDVNDYEFTVTDDNGLMDHTNALLPDTPLTYYPYYTAQGSAETGGESSLLNMAVAELSVGRLLESHNPILTITRRSNPADVVLSIPLIKYLELCKTVAHYDMSTQEYLDREDEYSMTFFLDANRSWVNTQIIINNWIVRYNDITGDFQ